MKSDRWVYVVGIVLVFILSSFCGVILAADYPERPLRVVVGYAPGGGSDRTSRTLQRFLEKEYGNSVVVENMPGAGGLVAQTALVRGKAEGYITTNVNFPAVAYGMIMRKTPFEFSAMTPLWIEVCDPIVIVVRKNSSWNNFADFVEAVRKEPGKYSASLASMGGQHANALWLVEHLGLDFKIVPYNSGSECASALLGGHVDICFGDAVSRADMRREFKCLAVVAEKAHPIWPEGQPLWEQLKQYGLGLPSKAFQARYGIYWVSTAFKEKWPERYRKLAEAFKRATKNPEYIALAEKSGLMPSLINEEGTGLFGGKDYQAEFNSEYEVIQNEIVPLFEKDSKK